MKILSCEAKNFASYGAMHLNMVDMGLTLVHGSTGSGKSTLQDIVPWVLYGITSKNGKADEIKSWHYINESTVASCEVELPDGLLTVYRKRGKSNDLYWLENGLIYRGADATDTQKLLEKRLGVSADLFIQGSCFSEFSPSASFFTSTAKNRREILEKLTNLSMPIKLASKSSEARKPIKTKIQTLTGRLNRQEGNLQYCISNGEEIESNAKKWDSCQQIKIQRLQESSKNYALDQLILINGFEYDRTREIEILSKELQCKLKDMNALRSYNEIVEDRRALTNGLGHVDEEPCELCGSVGAKKDKILSDLNKVNAEYEKKQAADSMIQMLDNRILGLKDSKNPYIGQSNNHYEEDLKIQRTTKNPYQSQVLTFRKNLQHIAASIKDLENEIKELSTRSLALSQIYDLSMVLRGLLLESSVKSLRDITNGYLEKYFDAEIKVSFNLHKNDEIEIAVFKSGYECSYRQLSKGQRGLLILCFSVAIMKLSANNSGVHFDTLFFDEVLTGLDESLKVKAYGLFEELSLDHSSILVIEHSSEFKTMFNNQIQISLKGDYSELEYA